MPGAVSLAEYEWPGNPERASLRRALRHGLRRDAPELRVIAEDFLAESTAIDLLAVGVEGNLVSIRIGAESDESKLFTQALADIAWLRPRLLDLLKLAPGIGLEAAADPRAMIFCPHFASETRLAAESLGGTSLELFEYRCLRQQGQLVLLLERCKPSIKNPRQPQIVPAHNDRQPLEPPHTAPSAGRNDRFSRSTPEQSESVGFELENRHSSLTDPLSPSTFRTGLTDADLQLDPTVDLLRS
jgi:hypothetical protein